MSDSREHIINTATNLFLQKGFKEVTMKELVDSAGISKGAFYHYFTSKEQVFEEVVLSFYGAAKIADYALLSNTSLQEFYKNMIKHLFNSNSFLNSKNTSRSIQNHYYIIFDGLRLVPAFRKVFDDEQSRELKSWIKIIDLAKENNEIKSTIASKEIAKMFMYVSDGLASNLILQNKSVSIKSEVTKIWDNIYSLIKA